MSVRVCRIKSPTKPMNFRNLTRYANDFVLPHVEGFSSFQICGARFAFQPAVSFSVVRRRLKEKAVIRRTSKTCNKHFLTWYNRSFWLLGVALVAVRSQCCEMPMQYALRELMRGLLCS